MTKEGGKVQEMKIAVCDDEAPIRELLKEKIQKYYFSQNIEFSITTFESGENLLNQREGYECDVLFLDVDMPGKNGMETAKEIRKTNKDMLIVFLTAYSEFVFESFKVDAFRYLVKPLKDQELEEVLSAVQHKLYVDDEEYLSFQFQNETYNVRYSDIIYIEGMRDKIWLYCKDDTYRWHGTLKALQELLAGRGFFQVHRSYIINMEKIQKYNSQEVILEGDCQVPISRYKLDAFKEAYIKFWSKIL